MPNYNVKPRLKKGDPKTKEIARMGGRAKKGKLHFKTAMIKMFKEELEKYKSGDKKALTPQLLVKSWLITSMKNPAMAKLVVEIMGELKQKIEHTGKDGGPIETKDVSLEEMSDDELLKLINDSREEDAKEK